ncbi:DUF1833 family protein [Marinibactrum halimedae]|uniref:DUF1833 domain-containing protein n=1 Tax=Marinibactrum halimedae TaxID=1444977 RepID=A0AA37TCC1_9GAMM|nr:DUF1833 family protein [Marinibactrum halimedae]MCD9458882.1 DUF1833 domain-containing protein [Marinibactrum halimedae]GLS27731.1 hypothetical protein GCM10007877_34500 [Marinibactrum halimedae]
MLKIDDQIQKEAIARADVNIQQIPTFEFIHPTFPEPIRVVPLKDNRERPTFDFKLDDNALFNPGEVVSFRGLAGTFTEPETSTEVDNTATVTLDAVSGEVQAYIAAANKTVYPVECMIRQYTYNHMTKTTLGKPSIIRLQVRGVTVTLTQVQMQLGYKNSANQKFPAHTYTPTSNPGLIE